MFRARRGFPITPISPHGRVTPIPLRKLIREVGRSSCALGVVLNLGNKKRARPGSKVQNRCNFLTRQQTEWARLGLSVLKRTALRRGIGAGNAGESL